jgi:hypothetical protein
VTSARGPEALSALGLVVLSALGLVVLSALGLVVLSALGLVVLSAPARPGVPSAPAPGGAVPDRAGTPGPIMLKPPKPKRPVGNGVSDTIVVLFCADPSRGFGLCAGCTRMEAASPGI